MATDDETPTRAFRPIHASEPVRDLSTRAERREPIIDNTPRRVMVPPPIPKAPQSDPGPLDDFNKRAGQIMLALLEHEKRAAGITLSQVEQAKKIEEAVTKMEPFALGWRWVPITLFGVVTLLAALLAVVSIVSVVLLGKR
jgi:hypothetical protein